MEKIPGAEYGTACYPKLSLTAPLIESFSPCWLRTRRQGGDPLATRSSSSNGRIHPTPADRSNRKVHKSSYPLRPHLRLAWAGSSHRSPKLQGTECSHAAERRKRRRTGYGRHPNSFLAQVSHERGLLRLMSRKPTKPLSLEGEWPKRRRESTCLQLIRRLVTCPGWPVLGRSTHKSPRSRSAPRRYGCCPSGHRPRARR